MWRTEGVIGSSAITYVITVMRSDALIRLVSSLGQLVLHIRSLLSLLVFSDNSCPAWISSGFFLRGSLSR